LLTYIYVSRYALVWRLNTSIQDSDKTNMDNKLLEEVLAVHAADAMDRREVEHSKRAGSLRL
jgi:hypothetical protein